MEGLVLCWILRNKTRPRQRRRIGEVAATMEFLPAKNQLWRPCIGIFWYNLELNEFYQNLRPTSMFKKPYLSQISIAACGLMPWFAIFAPVLSREFTSILSTLLCEYFMIFF